MSSFVDQLVLPGINKKLATKIDGKQKHFLLFFDLVCSLFNVLLSRKYMYTAHIRTYSERTLHAVKTRWRSRHYLTSVDENRSLPGQPIAENVVVCQWSSL
jgi:hypothetical protein